jgi:protein-S-isoprenylcysteine O-methyltransferase Ste14
MRRSRHGGGFLRNILRDSPALVIIAISLASVSERSKGKNVLSPKATAGSLLIASIVLSLAGLGGFVLVFARDFNVYWLILSPVIIVLYQLPAVYVFWLYRKRMRKSPKKDDKS